MKTKIKKKIFVDGYGIRVTRIRAICTYTAHCHRSYLPPSKRDKQNPRDLIHGFGARYISEDRFSAIFNETKFISIVELLM